ncbi:MAG: HAD-IIA family hydrolase [Candidatus Nanohaloarchaea archaeon]
MDPSEYKYYFFDLDKTLWNWDENIIGAEDLIHSLRDAGKKVRFHTDNTILSRQGYAEKLTSMGIPAEKEDILTSGYVAAEHLASEGISQVYAVGENGLMEELQRNDIEVSENADVALIGFDRQFNYRKLKRVFKVGEQQVYVCSSENTFRTSSESMPHQGAFNAAVETFAETELLGKPSEAYRDKFRGYFSYFADASLFIGDRLADIETGNRLGMDTAAVMSGDIDRESLANAGEMQEPDYGVSSLAKLRRRVI